MVLFRKAITKLEEILNKKTALQKNLYQPYIPISTDIDKLCSNLCDLLGLEEMVLRTMWLEYEQFSQLQNYAEILGERKTLATEEAFIIYVLASNFRPQNFVEIGTQHGRSTRRIIDLAQRLGLNASITCFDIVNLVKHFSPDEANLVLKDITETVKEDIFGCYESGIIYLDAHPYYLLKNVLKTFLKYQNWILVIHDCSRGLCNPQMNLSREDVLGITSLTGHWERHVLAEIFNVDDVMSDCLNYGQTESHVRMIFDTPHGICVILPKCFLSYE
ncbi:class I SAM-dependent methyltransferase [bacterium]|nr:class I SAM-dependent methyltransferase [bacterium]